MPSFVLFVALCHKTGNRTTRGGRDDHVVVEPSRASRMRCNQAKKRGNRMYEVKIIGDATVEGPDLADLDVNLLERSLRQDMVNRLEEVGLIIEGLEIKVKFLP